MSNKSQKRPKVIGEKTSPAFWIPFYVFMLLYAVFSLAPIVWMVMTSFKTRGDVYATPPLLIFQPSLESYAHIFFYSDIPRMLLNTVIISISSTALSLAVGLLSSYALARLPIPGREDIAFYILSIRMFPPIAAAIPIFLILRSLNLVDTHVGMIIAYTTFNLPFVVWMMRGFIENLPPELEEAAMVDGRSRLRAFLDVTLPLLKPSIVAIAIFCIIFSWNEFLFALILTTRVAKTMPVSITEFITWREVTWNTVAAAATILVIPVIIFTFLVQKYLVRGLTMGAVRG